MACANGASQSTGSSPQGTDLKDRKTAEMGFLSKTLSYPLPVQSSLVRGSRFDSEFGGKSRKSSEGKGVLRQPVKEEPPFPSRLALFIEIARVGMYTCLTCIVSE